MKNIRQQLTEMMDELFEAADRVQQKKHPVGWIVRYANTGCDRTPSESLHYDEKDQAFWRVRGKYYGNGSVFIDYEVALKAIINSVKYQVRHGYEWNRINGPYLIEPVYV